MFSTTFLNSCSLQVPQGVTQRLGMIEHMCALKASFLQDCMREAVALHNICFGP